MHPGHRRHGDPARAGPARIPGVENQGHENQALGIPAPGATTHDRILYCHPLIASTNRKPQCRTGHIGHRHAVCFRPAFADFHHSRAGGFIPVYVGRIVYQFQEMVSAGSFATPPGPA
jgi:hypothetical protein